MSNQEIEAIIKEYGDRMTERTKDFLNELQLTRKRAAVEMDIMLAFPEIKRALNSGVVIFNPEFVEKMANLPDRSRYGWLCNECIGNGEFLNDRSSTFEKPATNEEAGKILLDFKI